MQIKIWGARGSIPCPGPRTVRYGGNTSCVHVTLADGTQIVLDAGSGIRNLRIPTASDGSRRIHLLLTHLHLDHIQGMLFFAPLFDPQAEITIWGPAAPGGTLQDRIARYLSAPLSPVEVRDLPCQVDFRDCSGIEFDVGSARVRAESVNHRGPTLGFRITEGDSALCYIPDHEPALGGSLETLDPEWISGYALAEGADLLLHDCQYTDEEYPAHFGWGHSSLADALCFARRTQAKRTLLFHHDPYHSDHQLDAIYVNALEHWGDSPHTIEMATELREIEIGSGSPLLPGAKRSR